MLEISARAYREIVNDAKYWHENCGGDNRIAFELDGIGHGEYVIVTCLVEFGHAGDIVVWERYEDLDTAVRRYNSWVSDSIKLTKFYGARFVRCFELWHVVRDYSRSIGCPERYIAVECTPDDHIVGETVFGSFLELASFVHENRYEIAYESGHFGMMDGGDGEVVDCYDNLYYYECNEGDSQFPNSVRWAEYC